MSQPVLEQHKDPSVEVSVLANSVVRMSGVLREPLPQAWLAPLLERATLTAKAQTRAEVVLDMRELSYMNATGFRVILEWMRTLRRETPPLTLRIVSTAAYMWQRVSTSSLKSIGADAVVIEEHDRPSTEGA